MKTSELIDLLSATNYPVDPHWLAKCTAFCVLAAMVLVVFLVLATIGLRIDIAEPSATRPVILKVIFGASVSLIATRVFLISLRPGASTGRPAALVALPFVALATAAVAVLAAAPAERWSELIFGRHWLACLVLVPLYAMAPLGLFMAVARRGMPVQPRLTGAMSGLASGGLAMIAYALHCPDDAVPFMSTWYPLALAVCSMAGAALLPPIART